MITKHNNNTPHTYTKQIGGYVDGYFINDQENQQQLQQQQENGSPFIFPNLQIHYLHRATFSLL